jgi:cbb3-type cytochrome oxidase subunit 1
MWVKHLSSLQFLTYVAFFGVIVAAICKFVPGRAAPVRETPYPDEELHAHDAKTAKYFVAGGLFLVLGSVHMAVKNLPWLAEYLARTGYAGHLVRDLSNTHVTIVGGGTLLATGLCWLALPRIVRRPLASEGLAQCAFWFTAIGLAVFYVSLIGNGIAMGSLMEHGWTYPAAKAHMGDWYKAPTGMGAGIMGLGYWCFATNVAVTIFQARLVHVPKPQWHLWKFFATGAAALTVGTVQGVIQVQPRNADWLYKAGHAGEWIDPISHAHINLVTGLTMLVAGGLFALVRSLGGNEPSKRLVDTSFYALLFGSLAFYFVTLYLGFHEGGLVVNRGLSPEAAEEATPLHPYLIMGAGIAMFAAFWLLLVVTVRSVRGTRSRVRPFVLVGCGALAIGTLQGPIQALPFVNEALDRGGEAGDVIVNLHAQLNMLGGLMMLLVGLALGALELHGGAWQARRARLVLALVPAGIAVYYAAGVAFSAIEAHRVSHGTRFASAVSALEPWQALVLVPAGVSVLIGFGAFASAVWRMTARQRTVGREALAATPRVFTGKIPKRVVRRSPAALAGYELPLGLMGFPGVGWLFAGFPLTASVLLMLGPALTWAIIPVAFSPYGRGPLRGVGWGVELVWLPTMALISSAFLYRAHARRRARLEGRPPRGRTRRADGYRTRVKVALGGIGLLLVAIPFVPAFAGVGGSTVRYSYEPRLTRDVTGQFVDTKRGPVKLFSWSDPQASFPADALQVHPSEVGSLLVRAAAVDSVGAYQLFDLRRNRPVRLVQRTASPTQLVLAPARPLQPGRYSFLATHEGMFGGRDFAYLQVVPAGTAVTAISSRPRATAPAVLDALLPLCAALVALSFAGLLLRSLLRRPSGEKALWSAGFVLFAVAAACEAVAQRAGWSPGLFRTYYLAGGVLTVAYLGGGSAWLLLPKRARDVLLGGLLTATAAAAVTVALAPVTEGVLAATAHGRPPSNSALGGHAFLWAVGLNSFGSLFLIGGSLYSILRRQRVRANVWIGGGALIVALATGLSRAGSYEFVYAGELLGIALMFSGFAFVGKKPAPRPERRPVAVPEGARLRRRPKEVVPALPVRPS